MGSSTGQRLKSLLPSPIRKLGDRMLAGFVRPSSLLIRQWVGTVTPLMSQPRKLCLFAHFDPHGNIADYVVHYLEALHDLGIDIVFISASENLKPSEVDKILPLCIRVIQKKNLGLDFGSWKLGILKTQDWQLYDQLILANDSVYGPFFPLKSVFNKMEKKDLDLWGMTSTLEQEEHLQSYFLVIQKSILRTKPFHDFWEHFRFYRSKYRIISEYEIGLSRLAREHQWKLGAWVNHSELDLTAPSENPTLHHWDTLIEKHRFPFLKTEILKANRLKSGRVKEWKKILGEKSDYDVSRIEAHLRSLSSSAKKTHGRAK